MKYELADTKVHAREDMDALKRVHKEQIHEFLKKHAKDKLEMRDKHKR